MQLETGIGEYQIYIFRNFTPSKLNPRTRVLKLCSTLNSLFSADHQDFWSWVKLGRSSLCRK